MMYFVVALLVTFDLLTGAHSQQGNDQLQGQVVVWWNSPGLICI